MEQKPIHVVKKEQGIDFSKADLAQHQKDAEDKADELAVHFPNGMEYFVTAEQDDDGSLNFYLNFKLEF